MQMIEVRLPGDKTVEIPYGTLVSEILSPTADAPLVAALVNNEIVSVTFKVEVNSEIKPVSLVSDEGATIYRRSLCFLLAMACRHVFPDKRLVIGHSLADGYYYYFGGQEKVSPEETRQLSDAMQTIVKQNHPIVRRVLSYSDSIELFEKNNLPDTRLLVSQRNRNKVPVYFCGTHADLSYGPLVPSTGMLKCFALSPYEAGLLLRFPTDMKKMVMGEFHDNPVLFSVYQEYKNWGKILNVSCVGHLNTLAETNQILPFIRVSEALHDRKISQIADRIAEKKKDVKLVLIAGPSSSGKTTFTKKLAIELQVVGFNPRTISLDDYFLSREETPKDENGEYDFENINAIDISLLNKHLIELFEGKTVEIPKFDFKTGRKKDNGIPMTLEDRDILVMEGIHGLNDELTPLIKKDNKYKIYVSALTQLNLDDHNRVSTTDNRLIRRMVRDHQFRGHSAVDTLMMWDRVRSGENKYIFPFQNTADSAFNSALDYELGVLKTIAEPLLRTVKPHHEKYHEALRLEHFLENFISIPAQYVPGLSILREFIGESHFKY